MENNDYNMVKPVESLRNIEGLKPIERRKERKRKQNPSQQGKQQSLKEPAENELDDLTVANDEDEHTIDYCA